MAVGTLRGVRRGMAVGTLCMAYIIAEENGASGGVWLRVLGRGKPCGAFKPSAPRVVASRPSGDVPFGLSCCASCSKGVVIRGGLVGVVVWGAFVCVCLYARARAIHGIRGPAPHLHPSTGPL